MRHNILVDAFLFLLGICLNIALIAGVAYLIYFYALKGYEFGSEFSAKLTEEMPDKEFEFVLEHDTPLAEAAELLEAAGAIRDKYVFRLEIFLKDSSTYYKAGTYTLNQNMSNTDVNVTLRKQPEEEIPDNIITIPEGYTIRDIAMYLEDRELMDAEDFIEACETHDFPFSFVYAIPERPNRLEGYLFPDTYFISPYPSPDEIIYKMLARFDEIFTDEYRYRANEINMSIDEIVTIASLIEKEVRVASERPLVSEVIWNRLNDKYLLQIDATIMYALDKRRDRLSYADLEVDSPYNTYLYPGLPIGPIASPGESCLSAALYPESGRLYYYVLKDAETGEHFFTESWDSFVSAKELYVG